ncbi:MAG: archaellin/type IV pilin N-terminal domain-containing protein [Candidatus Bathyarchaeia archaeon]|jgi:flagellin-like protein|nr:hypothetical protein [Candidatus Bathyarchaeota archaeon A05DMB-4]MDH7594970.1 hypothetical protein [Candidatus Bathyarchaeota archaeon]
MRKLFKSRKALSPVVAAIILIAVTVAVSIAVAAWMGALTFSFTSTEQVSITNLQFIGASNNIIRVTMRNSGTTPVTINEAWVNNVQQSTTTPILPTTLAANSVAYLNITYGWTAGDNYEVKLVSSKGNTFLRSGIAPA